MICNIKTRALRSNILDGLQDVLYLLSMANQFALAIAATIGIAISAYFTLVFFDIIPANSRFVAQVCRMDEQTCQYVLHTTYAKLFGVPNSLLGAIFYAFILYTVLAHGPNSSAFISLVATLSSVLSVLASIYLTHALIVKLKTNCVLCFTCHALNLVILILLTYTG